MYRYCNYCTGDFRLAQLILGGAPYFLSLTALMGKTMPGRANLRQHFPMASNFKRSLMYFCNVSSALPDCFPAEFHQKELLGRHSPNVRWHDLPTRSVLSSAVCRLIVDLLLDRTSVSILYIAIICLRFCKHKVCGNGWAVLYIFNTQSSIHRHREENSEYHISVDFQFCCCNNSLMFPHSGAQSTESGICLCYFAVNFLSMI